MKKKLLFKFFVFAVIGSLLTVTSCKDYDDDINSLEEKISTLSNTLNDIKSKVDAGAVITKVESITDGVKVTLSNGNTFELKNGTDGAPGAPGKDGADGTSGSAGAPGTVITIGEDGFWYIDGIKTEYSSIGEKGADGEKGANGADGKDGIYFVPNADGYWYKVENGVETKTADLWLLPGVITAVMNSNGDVTFANVQAGNGTTSITFYSSKTLRSLTFVPDYTSEDGTPQILVRGLYELEDSIYTKTRNNKKTYDIFWLPQTLDKKLNGDIYKGYTELTYIVNPSNAKLGVDYTVEGLLEKVSTTIFRSSGDPFLQYYDAKEVDGKLVVRALIHKDAYNFKTDPFEKLGSFNFSIKLSEAYLFKPEGKDNISIALQVKNIKEMTNDEENFVVSSEFVRSRFALEPGFVQLKKGYLEGRDVPYTLPMHVYYDKIVLEDYEEDIQLWNGFNGEGAAPTKHEINLNDYVKGVFFDGFTNKVFDIDEYGFEDYKFIFEGIFIDSEGVLQTNDYIELDEETGVISVPFASNGLANQAAGGRTPIVLAKLMIDDNVYAVGYIKILITNNVDKSDVDDFIFELEDYELDCKSEYVLTDEDVKNIDFDQIFNHARIQLSKTDFFRDYRRGGVEVTLVSSPKGSKVTNFNLNNYVTFNWDMDYQTETGKMNNFLNINIKNTIPAGDYVVKTRLKSSSSKPDVVITWKFTIKLPKYSLTDNTAILSGNKITVNPTINEQGGKTSAAYEALLNNAFMHSGTSFTFTPLPGDCTNALTPYFVFTSVPTGYEISKDSTKVYKSGFVGNAAYLAAVIETDPMDAKKFWIRLNEEEYQPLISGASWGNYAPLTKHSKGLVGQSVSVQPRGYLNGAAYNWIILRTPFNVNFTYPLELNLPIDATVYDQADQGLNQYTLNLYNPVALADWKGREVNIFDPYGRTLIDHYEIGTLPVLNVTTDWVFHGYTYTQGTQIRPGHYGWWYAPGTLPTVTYNSPFVFDIDNAKCNIKPDGNIGGEPINNIPAGMNLKFDAVANPGSVTVITNGQTIEVATTFTFTWDNGATGAVENEFKIAVPVKVDHKWGTLTDKLIITVKPGIAP